MTSDQKDQNAAAAIVVELRPVGIGPPASVRFKGALKTLLRRHGLRCIDVRRPSNGQDDDSSSVASGRSRGREVSAAPAATNCGGGFHDGGGGQ